MIIIFEEFIDQLIDYPINRASFNNYDQTVCINLWGLRLR